MIFYDFFLFSLMLIMVITIIAIYVSNQNQNTNNDNNNKDGIQYISNDQIDEDRSLNTYNNQPEAAEVFNKYIDIFNKPNYNLPFDDDQLCHYGTLDDIDWNSVVFDANPKIIIY